MPWHIGMAYQGNTFMQLHNNPFIKTSGHLAVVMRNTSYPGPSMLLKSSRSALAVFHLLLRAWVLRALRTDRSALHESTKITGN